MTIPGFTAEAALSRMNMSRQFRTDRIVYFDSREDIISMQMPNSQNTPGGSCYGFTSGTLISGTYDSQGRCCTAPANSFPVCIDCDKDKCYDRRPIIFGGNFGYGTYQGGVFKQV
jgi:hypothetical protein